MLNQTAHLVYRSHKGWLLWYSQDEPVSRDQPSGGGASPLRSGCWPSAEVPGVEQRSISTPRTDAPRTDTPRTDAGGYATAPLRPSTRSSSSVLRAVHRLSIGRKCWSAPSDQTKRSGPVVYLVFGQKTRVNVQHPCAPCSSGPAASSLSARFAASNAAHGVQGNNATAPKVSPSYRTSSGCPRAVA